jgi:hypothetical protein
MINETVVDRWIARTIAYNKGSDTHLKYACINASPVVGKYALGGTKAIADGIQRSVSTVENYAHAHWLYMELRKNKKDLRRVRELWRILPASHWWQAWDIQQAGYEAFSYLHYAQCNHWSGRDMMQEYKRDREIGNAPILFHRACRSIFGLASELLKQTERLTEAQHMALLSIVDTFETE